MGCVLNALHDCDRVVEGEIVFADQRAAVVLEAFALADPGAGFEQ